MNYPAKWEKESETMYSLGFIDFPGAITQGKDMQELHRCAQDVLSLAIKFNLDRNIEIPEPSQIQGDDIIMIEPYPEILKRMSTL
ncbi:MAG: type II toxin-antitoxin system HicB family antitoxin [Vulcanimicrobiota bacterium]